MLCLQCRVAAARKEAIEQGYAAERALDMRLAVQCFQVTIPSCSAQGACHVHGQSL